MECSNKKEAGKIASDILKRLEKARPDHNRHEWVIINETFDEIIDKTFTIIEKIVQK